MLFDLRGRGRRRTVQMIYLGLALLMGIGLVGFGIGGGLGSGGLFNAVTSSSGGGTSFGDKVKADQKVVARNPNSATGWANLAHDAFQQAGTGSGYDTTTGQFTSNAHGSLVMAQNAWNQYLALNPARPDPDLANLMVRVFSSPGALNQPASAVRALQIVIASQPPSLALYEDLAVLAYQAHNTREGDLAAARAVSLAPKAQQAQLKTELAALKKNPNGTASSGGAAAAGATVAPAQTSQTVSVPASTATGAATPAGSSSKSKSKTGK